LYLRHLHSFPTRRSSDLEKLLGRSRVSAQFRRLQTDGNETFAKLHSTCDAVKHWYAMLARQFQREISHSSAAKNDGLGVIFPDRSEEHTSELQSLAYLVC